MYKVTVQNSNFKRNYNILASNLKEASIKAKIQFGKDFSYIGNDVKVSLQQEDLKNHIDEIITNLYGNR